MYEIFFELMRAQKYPGGRWGAPGTGGVRNNGHIDPKFKMSLCELSIIVKILSYFATYSLMLT